MGEKDELLRQIRQNMGGKSTDELQQIWLEQDQAAWSGEAFEAIERILMERTGELPSRENYAREREKAAIAEEDDEAETYYAFPAVIRVASLADIAAWVILIGYLLDWAVNLYMIFRSYNAENLGIWLLNLSVVGFSRILTGIYLFVILKAIAQGIYLLVDIEENTRPRRAAGTQGRS